MRLSHEDFVKRIHEISPTIEILGEYTKSTEPVRVRCNICGNEWSPKAYSLSQGKGCPHCSAKQGALNNTGITGLKSKDTFVSQLKMINISIDVIGEYVNTHTDILCKCKRCGNEWYAKPYSLLQGHGCPKCSKSGTSFMEQFILRCFQLTIGFEKVISRDKNTIGMELDIYIPFLNFAIEPGNWNLHKNNIDRDSLKRERCAEKGITLFTIYDVYPYGEKPPFENNCRTFNFDLNKENHTAILNLVYDLFRLLGINRIFTSEEIEDIENKAYDFAKSTTHDEFVDKMKKVNPNICILGTYQNSNRRVLVKCKSCGYEWNAVPSNLLAGDGCKKCGTQKSHLNFIKGQADFINEVKKVNPNIEILGEYTGRHNPVLAKCSICGYTWEPIASSLLRGSSHKGAKRLHNKTKEQ